MNICFKIGLFTLITPFMILSQEQIDLPFIPAEDMIWEHPEREFFSDAWQTEVVTNVSTPTLTVFKPTEEKNTGTSVIIAPGGGLYALSITSEGTEVAQWLADHGITAFVLRYRLIPTGEDGSQEIMTDGAFDIFQKVGPVLPISIQDGLSAIQWVREHAQDYGIKKDKIGFMGFSAGGAVTIGVSYFYSNKNRPNFTVPVYPWTDVISVPEPKKDAPNMMIVCATDDPIGLSSGSIELYQAWQQSDHSVALHMFNKGGHGFGMKKQGTASDHWLRNVHEWMISEGIVKNME